jgi:hypothetical protein
MQVLRDLGSAQSAPRSRAPCRAQLAAVGGGQFRDGGNTELPQARFQARADAAQVAQFQPVQGLGQIGRVEDDEAVGLLHVGRGLGQKYIRADADGTAQKRPDLAADGRLDVEGQRPRGGGFAPMPREAAGHFINRMHGLDVHLALDDFHQFFVQDHVFPRARLDEQNIRAQLARVAHNGAGFDAMFFGLVRHRDAAAGLGHGRHNAQRTPAQVGPQVLLARRKKCVEVQKEPIQRHAG